MFKRNGKFMDYGRVAEKFIIKKKNFILNIAI